MSKEIHPRGVGRPRKNQSEKASYQHIAVHTKDYNAFLRKVTKSNKKKVEVFHEMVQQYVPVRRRDPVKRLDEGWIQ